VSVTPIRPARRLTKRQQVHADALAGMGRADRLRYACEQLAAAGEPVGTRAAREWVAAHNGAENPKDGSARGYASKIVNAWLAAHGEPQTGGIPIVSTVAPADPEPDTTTLTAPAAPTTEPESLAPSFVSPPPAVIDIRDGVHPEPEPEHTPEHIRVQARVHTPGHSGVQATVQAGVEPELERPSPYTGVQSARAGAATDTATGADVHAADPAPVHSPAHVGVHTVPLFVQVTKAVAPVQAAPEPEPEREAPAALKRLARWLRWPSVAVLLVVSIASFVLSYESLQSKAADYFGGGRGGDSLISYGFPLAVDLFILGASLAYLAGAVLGRALPGWRITAHLAIAGTVALNATAGNGDPVATFFHVIGPLGFAAIIELSGAELLLWNKITTAPVRRDGIPLTLWISSPVEQVRTWLYMRRRGITSAIEARAAMGTEIGALMLLKLALSGADGRAARRVLRVQLRRGATTPEIVMAGAMAEMNAPTGDARRVLREIVADSIKAQEVHARTH
jgi:hypothetical protein